MFFSSLFPLSYTYLLIFTLWTDFLPECSQLSGHYLVHDCADNALNTVAFSMPCKGIEKTALRLDPYIPYLIATNLSCNAIYIS